VKTGLLLGAGFSKDFGLPLVTEVTKTFKETSKKYWSIDNAARIRADGYSDEIAREVRSVLERDEMYFEAILSFEQYGKRRNTADRAAQECARHPTMLLLPRRQMLRRKYTQGRRASASSL
jgi:hypothetical protein